VHVSLQADGVNQTADLCRTPGQVTSAREPTTARTAGLVGALDQLAVIFTYRHLAADDLLTQVVMERMLAGIATCRHVAAGEPVGEQVEAQSTATSRSAVSRRFVAATKTALAELLAADLSELKTTVLMVDGLSIAERCCVVALGTTAEGTKVPLGLWEGDTENKTVVKHLLADLADRGLETGDGLPAWADIGALLGTTGQAASQRYGRRVVA
jgi:hypothetical protein